MQIVKTFIATIITVSILFVMQPAKPVKAAGSDQLVLLICNNIKGNDKYRLRKLLKENRLKIKKIYTAIKCDGLSMIQYALQNNAVEIGVFIVKRAPSSLIKKSNDLAWATDNGFADHEITAAIKKRIGG